MKNKSHLKVSKAQLEVWEWKEKAYEEMKDMTSQERLKYLHEQTKDLVDQIKKARQNKK